MEKKKIERSDIVAGRNPVMELLRSSREVECVYIQGQAPTGPLGRIIALAKQNGVPVKNVSAQKLSLLAGGVHHQGVAAMASAADYGQMQDIYDRAGTEPLFVVLADGIEDPHNLGAIIRTAEAAGAHGVIIPKRHSAGLTAATAKAAAGATAYLPVVRVPNLAAAMDELKKMGVWFYCADMNGQSWNTVDYGGAVGLVIGSEGEGVSRLVREKCDFVVSLPMWGQDILAQCFGGRSILLYEIARRRHTE